MPDFKKAGMTNIMPAFFMLSKTDLVEKQ